MEILFERSSHECLEEMGGSDETVSWMPRIGGIKRPHGLNRAGKKSAVFSLDRTASGSDISTISLQFNGTQKVYLNFFFLIPS